MDIVKTWRYGGYNYAKIIHRGAAYYAKRKSGGEVSASAFKDVKFFRYEGNYKEVGTKRPFHMNYSMRMELLRNL